MIQIARVADFAGIEMECRLPGSREDVWGYLTQSDLMARWIGRSQFPNHRGGIVELQFDFDSDAESSSGGPMDRGVVTQWPPFVRTTPGEFGYHLGPNDTRITDNIFARNHCCNLL